MLLPEADPQLCESKQGPRDPRPYRRSGGSQFLDGNGCFDHEQPGSFCPEDQLRVEDVLAELATGDQRFYRRPPHRFDAVRVAHPQSEPRAKNQREDACDHPPPEASTIDCPGGPLGSDHDGHAFIAKQNQRLVEKRQIHEVDVEVDYDIPTRRQKPGSEGCSVISLRQPDCLNLSVRGEQFCYLRAGSVSGPVFRDDDLELVASVSNAIHHRFDGRLEVALFVVGRHDDRNHGSLMLSARRKPTQAPPTKDRIGGVPGRTASLLVWLAAGAGCGVMVALSVPPFGFWPLAWLGFAGVAFLLPGSSLGSRAVLGAGLGLGQYAVGLAWVSEFSIPGCVALIILGGLFGSLALLLVPSSRASTVAVGMPAAFVLTDWVRAHFPLGGFPLGGTSLGQALSPLVPTVRLGGSLLLTAETALIGVVAAQLVRTAMSLRRRSLAWPVRARPEGIGGASAALVVAIAVAIALPLAGWLSPSGQGGRYRPLRVALVQGGGERGTRAIHTDPELVFQRHLAASSAIRPPVDLVVFPEGILQTDQGFADSPDGVEVARLATSLRSTVILGVEQDVGVRHYLNEVAAWSPQGTVAAVYVKNHLVPFGEYVPWRSFISRYFNVSDVPLDAIAGHSSAYLRTPAAPLGVMISYEVFFDDRARSGVRSGGQLLVVPTNTASYRSSQVPAQELAAARLRAWETGRWLLQVTPTGYTAVVTPRGAVVTGSTLGQQAVIQAVVPRYDGRTVYVITGDTPWVLAAGFLLVWMALLPRIARVGSVEAAKGHDEPARSSLAWIQEHRSTVLLVCTGNQCRSPMAEAILSGLLAERGSNLLVRSAGLVSEGARCPPEVLDVMAPLGYDLTDHRSRVVNSSDLAEAGLIIGMTRQHSIDLSLMAPAARLRTFTLWEVVRLGGSFGSRSPGESLSEWALRVGSDRSRSSALNLPLAEDISDPIGKPLRAYTETRDVLLQLARRLLDLLQPV